MTGLFIAAAALQFVGLVAVIAEPLPPKVRVGAALTSLFIVGVLVLGAICL